MDDRPSEPSPFSRRIPFATFALVGLAGLVLLTGILASILRFLTADEHSSMMIRLIEPLILYGLSLLSAGLLVGLAVVLQGLHLVRNQLAQLQTRVQEAARDIANSAGPALPTNPPATESPRESLAGPLQEVITLLRDIRDNSLLSEEERLRKATHVVQDEIADAEQRFRALLSAGNLSEARDLADSMGRRFPDNAEVRAWPAQLERTRQQQRSGDLAATSKEVNDLISMSSWTKARALAQQLFERYPDSLEARQLLVRIERENKLAEDEQRRRMHAEVQRFVTRRRWEEALAAARTFIERFPMSAEAEALRVEIPTLEANAEIETRQQLEARIMDWAKHGRYIEAAALARTVIEKYPDSPQAEALRSQLHRLDELAHNPAAPPARIRIE